MIEEKIKMKKKGLNNIIPFLLMIYYERYNHYSNILNKLSFIIRCVFALSELFKTLKTFTPSDSL